MRETARDQYRRISVESATPAGLIGLLYEGIIIALRRAAAAAEAGQIGGRVEHANRALAIVAHLRGSLDLERGGRVAAALRQFYALAERQIVRAGVENSSALFTEWRTQFAGVREAWRAVERDEARGFPPAASAASGRR